MRPYIFLIVLLLFTILEPGLGSNSNSKSLLKLFLLEANSPAFYRMSGSFNGSLDFRVAKSKKTQKRLTKRGRIRSSSLTSTYIYFLSTACRIEQRKMVKCNICVCHYRRLTWVCTKKKCSSKK